MLRAAASDTLDNDLLIQPLRGKFFIPEAPAVSIICTPLSDTTLSAGDTLTFNATITNHSDTNKSPKFFIYGTTTGPDAFTFLAVDTSQIMQLPPGGRKRDITDLEVPAGAPQGHYIFTAFISNNDSIFDEDPFGFQIDSTSSMPGSGDNQLASLSREMGPWKILNGWFGYNERGGGESGGNVASASLPKAFSLSQNYPNPFNPSTTIQYAVPDGKGLVNVKISVYDLRGRLVDVLVDEPKTAGHYSIQWNGTDGSGIKVSSGIYLFRVHAGDFISTRKMVMLK